MKRIKTLILCGGMGYRLKEETEFKPKPMVEIGGRPILWHIMKIYERWGFHDFIIALGYKGNLIKDYFVNEKFYDGDFTLESKKGKISHHRDNRRDNFRITFADTGLESLTGERVRLIKPYIKEKEFMVTYGDGLADINLNKLLKFHRRKKTMATVTTVKPILKYGGFKVDKNGMAISFQKKVTINQPINGGFMVFNKKIFDFIKKDSMIEDLFFDLIKMKQLALYVHEGFFHAMDTYQDMQDLNEMWSKDPTWKVWS